MAIEFKGRVLQTDLFDGTLEPEKLKYVRDNFYKTTKEQALDQLKKVLTKGNVTTNKIFNYYFENIANNCLKRGCKWSINEMLESDELLQLYINKTYRNKKVFSSPYLDINVRTSFRLGAGHTLGRMTNFPLKECLKLMEKYITKESKVYIDPCCGWGTRMIASAILDLEYIGFEVNSDLVEKLKELGSEIVKIKPNFKFTILEQGSQYFVPELVDKADIILTSPPYFDLENYVNNEYETNKNILSDYDTWVSEFVKPMLENMQQYAKSNSFILMNVKDFLNYSLTEDFKQATDLDFVGLDTLKNSKRVNQKHGVVDDNSEPVLVFKK